MCAVTVKLPDELDDFVRDRMKEGGFSSMEEYLTSLVVLEQARRATDELKQQLREGLQSELIELTDEEWESIERETLAMAEQEEVKEPPRSFDESEGSRRPASLRSLHRSAKQEGRAPISKRRCVISEPWPLVSYGNYVIYYRTMPNGIDLVRIMHGAQRPERHLRDTDE